MAGKTATTSSNTPKHRACDECRSRKLACSKEADGCSRCRREGIACYYSPQKPMGRPRKHRSAEASHNDRTATSSSRRRHVATPMQRSNSAGSSAASTGPEIHSFQLNSTATPPSFMDQNFDFLDQNIGSPDIAFLDLLPGYYPDTSVLPPQPVSSPQPGCTTQSFNGSIPALMARNDIAGAFGEIPNFLDPVLTAGQQGDNYDTYVTTPALSAGSHTPYASEPSCSPLPATQVFPRKFLPLCE
ncbi:hypothetical protein NQ176_g9301 [Zarea fungicola]|uniref:Uncharacterized protein n=1 Tax=Zarea fungicola TaxID=93591 RepID=A0ACC1MML1_9HYPO|nr:hypothetical protein NQ176_g9301 [Lecanicillium fungicola]